MHWIRDVISLYQYIRVLSDTFECCGRRVGSQVMIKVVDTMWSNATREVVGVALSKATYVLLKDDTTWAVPTMTTIERSNSSGGGSDNYIEWRRRKLPWHDGGSDSYIEDGGPRTVIFYFSIQPMAIKRFIFSNDHIIIDETKLNNIVGALQCLTFTWPDITYAILVTLLVLASKAYLKDLLLLLDFVFILKEIVWLGPQRSNL